MTPDFRALAQELANELDNIWQCLMDNRRLLHPLANDVRAALATPPPAPPTDEELLALEKKLWHEYKTIPYQGDEFMYDDGFRYALRDYRAALERWGHV